MRTESTARTLVGVDIQEREMRNQRMLSLADYNPKYIIYEYIPLRFISWTGKKKETKESNSMHPSSCTQRRPEIYWIFNHHKIWKNRVCC